MANTALNAPARRRALMSTRRFGRFVRQYGAAAALMALVLLGLEWALPALGVPAFLVPPPSRVLARLLEPGTTLYGHALATASAAMLGLGGGALFGIALATLFVHVRALERVLYPWVLVSQAIPAAALAPMLTIWFGNGLAPRAATAALFAFFPVLVATVGGLRRLAPEHLVQLRAWGATPWQTLRFLRWPSALPMVFSGLKVAAALAVVGAIVGELAGASRGLGYIVTVSVYRLQTDRVFAAIVLAAALSLSLHVLITLMERRVVFWGADDRYDPVTSDS
jgi:ABC-type nitrate/sulfonate/bicarbonate transport system permease component